MRPVLNPTITKRRVLGFGILAIMLVVFIVFSRFPKLDTISADVAAATSPGAECFQGFCVEQDKGFFSRWIEFSLSYFEIVAAGMAFAFLVAGLTEAFLFPPGSTRLQKRGILSGTVLGLAIGPVWNLCSACIVPIANSFQRVGAGTAGAIAVVHSSSTLNLPAIIMVLFIFSPTLAFSRILLAIIGVLVVSPLVAAIGGDRQNDNKEPADSIGQAALEEVSFRQALSEGLRDWVRTTLRYLVRLGPIMIIAGLASGLAIQWVSPEHVTQFLGNNVSGIIVAATIGILINVPLLFEIPLVALLLLLGMGTAPAATLLYVAAASGPITFWGLSKVMTKRAVATLAIATWTTGVLGGIAVLSYNWLSSKPT